MLSPIGERALEDAFQHGNALLKFIARNDVHLPGSNQAGFYLPKFAYPLFTPFPPTKGVNNDHFVNVTWADGTTTKSCIKWYSRSGNKNEYRLTGFNRIRHFYYRKPDRVGDLLVLIAKNQTEFIAYVLAIDEDKDDLQAALGVFLSPKEGALYLANAAPPEDEDDCINQRFRAFVATLTDKLPLGQVFAEATHEALESCISGYDKLSIDKVLLRNVEAEFILFQMAERFVHHKKIHRLFESVDEFLRTAKSITQARVSRAGNSFEYHFEYVLKRMEVPFDSQPEIDGNPDIAIPSRDAYYQSTDPEREVFVVGVKTSCKDRWRQVVEEAKRVKRKYILTRQEGISSGQLELMAKAGVTLIVPEDLHFNYPKDSPTEVLTIAQFVERVHSIYPPGEPLAVDGRFI